MANDEEELDDVQDWQVHDDDDEDVPPGKGGGKGGSRRTRVLASGAVVEDLFKATIPPNAPKFHGNKGRRPGYFRLYEKRVKNWKRRAARALPPEDFGPALLEGLDDDALLDMDEIDDDKLTEPDGAQYLIEALRAAYAQRPVVRMGELLDDCFERT